MSQVPKLCNDMMNLGRLQGFEVGMDDVTVIYMFYMLYCTFRVSTLLQRVHGYTDDLTVIYTVAAGGSVGKDL